MKTDIGQENASRSENCSLCGSTGIDVYRELKDRLFGTPGEWQITQCSNKDCALAWINPQVTKEALPSLYVNYYTHAEDEVASDSPANPTFAERLLDGLRKLSGFEKAKNNANLMYLSDQAAGRVLDVGCGDGLRLNLFSELGWTAEGQDVDVAAVENARSATGHTIHLGEVGSLGLDQGGYDAVVSNHVLEHVLDPRLFLSELKGLLRPGGKLVVVVPNFSGSGHAIFGPDWIGNDPPRHLSHFSPRNFRKLATLAGLGDAKVFSSVANAEVFALTSYLIRKDISIEAPHSLGRGARVLAFLWQYLAVVENWLRPDRGDECVMIWTAKETND